jgi:hypothetical protein
MRTMVVMKRDTYLDYPSGHSENICRQRDKIIHYNNHLLNLFMLVQLICVSIQLAPIQ